MASRSDLISTKTAKSNSDLPEEIVIEILTLLPVKSVLRFKSVSKPWLNIISNPQLLRIPKLLAIANAPFHPNCEIAAACPVEFKFLETPSLFSECKGIGSCNGIVCLVNCNCSVIFLWNPLIKQCKRVSMPDVPFWMNYNCIGFGYDSVSNDHKILLCEKGKVGSANVLVLKLYSTNLDSWRDIPVPDHIRDIKRGPFIDGVFYFKAENGIVSFDLHNEVFELIPFPSFEIEDRSDVLDFEGSVAMIFKSVSDGTISLWTLDDVSGEVVWTKKVTFGAMLQMMNKVFLYVGGGKFVRSGYGWNRLIWFDYERNVTFYFELTFRGSILSVLKYTETFVSIKGFESVDKLIVEVQREREYQYLKALPVRSHPHGATSGFICPLGPRPSFIHPQLVNLPTNQHLDQTGTSHLPHDSRPANP